MSESVGCDLNRLSQKFMNSSKKIERCNINLIEGQDFNNVKFKKTDSDKIFKLIES